MSFKNYLGYGDAMGTKKKQKMRGTKKELYELAVEWIAANDETAERDPRILSELVSVAMVADVFELLDIDVANDVLRMREEEDGN